MAPQDKSQKGKKTRSALNDVVTVCCSNMDDRHVQ